MKKGNISESDQWISDFEKNYICTYQEIYDHIRLLTSDLGKTRELLICTYVEVYKEKTLFLQQKEPVAWMKEQVDKIAEKEMEISREVIEASYAEEKMREKGVSHAQKFELDETTVFLEIGDRIQEYEQQNKKSSGPDHISIIRNLFSWCVLLFTIVVLINGISKAKHQLDVMKEPFVKPLIDLEQESEEAEKKKNENRIMVGGKAVYLSDIGQVLYSVPLEETDMEVESNQNPEIQKQAGWTYFLACPERKETQLGEVSPDLYHILFRLQGDGEEIEIIETDVQDYLVLEDGIYVSSSGSIRKIDSSDRFKKKKPGIYIRLKDGEFYVYDELGRVLNTEADGNIHYGDRILEMSSNRIVNVKPAVRQKGNIVFELKSEDGENADGKAIYRKENGKEEIFVEEGKGIDSFCIVGDWIYYSAYMKKSGSGKQSSQIFRKSIIGEDKAEKLKTTFPGRISQMYYCEENDQIYADYLPMNWKNHHGVIAAISLNGQISVLEDEDQRSVRETTGNDVLRFVMMKDDQVFCFWEDNYWEKGENPIVIWQDVLVLSNSQREYLDEN